MSDSRSSRRLDSGRPRRSWLRILGLPVVVLVVAWTLQARSGASDSETLEQLDRDARAFVRTIVGNEPGLSMTPVALGEAAPGVRAAAVAAVMLHRRTLRSEGWSVTVVSGDTGPPPSGPTTHTATVLAGETPVVHLRLAAEGARSLLCGHWLPVP